MDQPSKSESTKENGQEVTCGSHRGPKRVDPYQEVEKITQGDLGKQDEKNDHGNDKRNQKSFQGLAPVLD